LKSKLEKKLTVKSTTENLAKIRDFIKSAAESCGFNGGSTEKITLAVDEAVTNIIKHAYKYSPDGDINLSVKCNGKKFIVSIVDHGITFDSSLVPEPNLKKYYEQRKVGGLGIFLMKKLMDEVEYRQIPNDKNQVRLVKYIS
jgi:serine/threonine-protein kinase RsbW